MDDRQRGYVYQGQDLRPEALRALLKTPRRGWAWTPARLSSLKQDHEPALEDEGRAALDDMEIRWRRTGASYDVLVLALSEQQLEGFQPLTPAGGAWRVRPASYGLQGSGPRSVERVEATCFLAPNGAIQFVALIDSARESRSRR
ncbi:MAG: hypothetical protein KatS3mg057_1154 [Herpetosiphonaceae bacterium]|nr:MAG: hypothetical protein KatS3mg057_1154 [Herpetosiphonaceae bacterium]